MKKNKYVRPEIEVAYIEPLSMLSTSGVTSGNGIGYGGKDESGTINPSTSKKDILWDEDF